MLPMEEKEAEVGVSVEAEAGDCFILTCDAQAYGDRKNTMTRIDGFRMERVHHNVCQDGPASCSPRPPADTKDNLKTLPRLPQDPSTTPQNPKKP